MKAVILAAGRGNRLNQKTKKIPKPMLIIGGYSVLEHQINFLKKNGIREIIIIVGYLSHVIKNYFKDGKNFGVNITYFDLDKPLGTAGHLKLAENELTDNFIVLYGDIMLDIDIEKFIKFHKNKNSNCTLVIHPNDHPHDSDLLEIDDNHRIIAFHSKPHLKDKYLMNLNNACVYIMSPKILKYIKSEKEVELDFGKHIFPKIFKKEKLFGYNTPEYIKDMGTPERLKQVTKDYLNNKIQRLNSKNKRKAIFLDRDGTINYDTDNLSNIDDFKFLPKIAQAIKLINSSEYLLCVVTNQPVLARGLLSFKDLDKIHKKMDTLLGQQGAKIDKLYFCPHHPEKEFPGVPELRIKCNCRKPKPGMILKAAKELNIDLTNSWIIGDSWRDIEAGRNAKINTILIKRNQQKFEKCQFRTKKTNDLYSAVKLILK